MAPSHPFEDRDCLKTPLDYDHDLGLGFELDDEFVDPLAAKKKQNAPAPVPLSSPLDTIISRQHRSSATTMASR